MLIVISTHAGDIQMSIRLMEWIAKLNGGPHDRSIVVIMDRGVQFDDFMEFRSAALEAFKDCTFQVVDIPDRGWEKAPNAMFKEVCLLAGGISCCFLYIEPDCVPLRKGWLEAIEAEYLRLGKPYMGDIYVSDKHPPSTQPQFMSGIAVYPATAFQELKFDGKLAWDMENAQHMIANGAHTDLIRHRWGEKDLPPTFVERIETNAAVNAFTPEMIRPQAVLFHRNKDGTLIDILDRRLHPKDYRNKMTIVFPVHAGDIRQAVRHAEWLEKMGVKHDHDAIISHDVGCPIVILNRLEQLLKTAFRRVTSFVYPRPRVMGYPAVANWAWQNTAAHMTKSSSPWFWMEADACALVPDWVERIQSEYDRCGKKFMGPHVKGMSHANGVMVYPPEAAEIMKTAMRLVGNGAFDYSGAQDYMPHCHDASSLIQHVWTIMGDAPSEVGGGQLPTHMNADQARRWIRHGTVIFHRLKSNDLIDLLISGGFRP